MSRKINRRDAVIREVDEAYRVAMRSPEFAKALRLSMIKPKPKYIPGFLWGRFISFVLR